MSATLKGGLIALRSYVSSGQVRRDAVRARVTSASSSRRPGRLGRTIALVVLALGLHLFVASPIQADTYSWTGPGDLAVNKTGTGGDDTFTFTNFNFDDFITGSLDGGGGTDTLNLGQGGWIQATLSNFEELNKSGDFSEKTTLDTNLDVTDFTQTEGLTYLWSGHTLTTATTTIHGGAFYALSGTTFNATVVDVQDTASMGIYGTGPNALTVTVAGHLGVNEGGTMSGLTTLTNDGQIQVDGTYNYNTLTVGAKGLGATYSVKVEGQSSDGVSRSGGFLAGVSIIIENGGDMWVEGGEVTATTIEIQSGGQLRIEDIWAGGGRFLGTVNATSITVQSGGTLDLQSGGVLNLTSALNMPAGAWSLNLQGDITINGGAGTITGDDSAQSLTIGGVFNANANLGGGNDTVTVTGSGVNGTLDGGDGTDTLILSGGTLSTTTQNFEVLNANNGTLATNLDLGVSGTATVSGNLIVANGGTLTTNSLSFSTYALVTVDAGGVINTTTLSAANNSQFNVSGTVTVTTSTSVGAWSGKIIVENGGTFSGAATTIGSNNAYITVENGGQFNYTTLQVNGGGALNVYGQAAAATSTSVTGTVTVYNTGNLSGAAATINSGGTVNVNAGGALTFTTLTVASGGTLNWTDTVVNNGGVLNLNAGATFTFTTITINAGGTFNGNITGDNTAQTLTHAGTLNGDTDLGGGNDTINLQTGAVINSTLSGGSGTNTLNLDGAGNLTATVQDFQVLNKTGTGLWILDTDVDLGPGGTTTVSGGSLYVSNTRSLTTNTLNLSGDVLLYCNGTITVGGGAGTITGDNVRQRVQIQGTLNGNIDLSGGDDTLTLQTGATINSTLGGGTGTDTLNLDGGGTLTATIQNFENLNKTGAGTWSVETDINLGAGGSTVINGGTLAVATGRIVTTNTLNLTGDVGLTVGGTMTVGGGAGTVTGDAGAQTLTIAGTLNGNADLGDGNDTVNLQTGAIVNSTLSGGGGTNTLNLDGAGTLTATIQNFQVAGKTGAGTWTVDVDLDLGGGGGTTTITAGTMVVAAGRTLTSPTVTIVAGGTLGGNGQVTGNVTNNGTVGPGNSIGTLTVAGNYVQGGGGTLQVEVKADGTNDLLHATGSATLAGTLDLVTVGTYTGSNQHVVLVADGGIIGAFDTVSGLAAASSLRHRFGVSYTATQVIVGVTVLTYESLVRGYNPRVVCVARCLDTIANSATGDMATIINQLDQLPDVASLAGAFSQMHCGHYHALGTVNFDTQRLFIALGQARLYQLRTGIAVTTSALGLYNPTTGPLLAYGGDLGRLGRLMSSDGAPETRRDAVKDQAVFAGPPVDVLRTAYAGHRIGVWVRPFGIFEDQDSTDSLTGYNYTTSGFSAGFDYRFSTHFIAGVSLGYAATRVDYDDAAGSDGRVETFTAGVYGTWFGPRWFVEASVTYARNSFDMNRKIKFGGVDRTAGSDYSGLAVSAQLGGGYDFPLAPNWTLGPVLSLEAVYQEQEGFTETGAGALNLTMDRQTATSVRSAVGIRVKRVWRGDQGRRVTLSLSALWVHEYAGDAQGVNASMQGNPAAPFTVNTPEPERDALSLGIGVTARVSSRVALFAAYQPEFKKGNQSHFVSAGIRVEF